MEIAVEDQKEKIDGLGAYQWCSMAIYIMVLCWLEITAAGICLATHDCTYHNKSPRLYSLRSALWLPRSPDQLLYTNNRGFNVSSRDRCVPTVHDVDYFKSSSLAKSTIHSLVDVFCLEGNSPEAAKVLLLSDSPVHCVKGVSLT